MSTHTFKRIVTFMGYPDILCESPRIALSRGYITVSLPDKARFFVVRDVVYDESMTPMYSKPSLAEQRYYSLQDIKANHPFIDSPILDNDHSLKTWNNG